jgi:hypothetical protein
MAQIGHTDPAFTLRLYTHEMQREDGEEQRLRALVDGAEWAPSAQIVSDATHRGASSMPPTAEKPR